MKIYHLTIVFLLSATHMLIAQSTLTVTLTGTKVVVPLKQDDFFYSLPLDMKFDASFKKKKISFYSEAVEAKKITDAKFEDDISHLPDGSYKIMISTGGFIGIADGKKGIPQKEFFIKIDNSDFSPVIRINKIAAADADPAIGGNPAPPVVSSGYVAGFVVLDAIELRKLQGDASKKQRVEEILSDYKITNQAALGKNFFLNDVFKHDALFQGARAPENDEGGAQGFADVFSSFGGLDVTTVADGISKYLVKRAKEELSITFFQHFKEDLRKNADLKTVFPNTFNLLEAIDEQAYNFSNYTDNLREAFRSDLSTLDEHLPGIITNHPEVFSKPGNFEYGVALRTGCYLAGALKHQVHPGDILENYPVSSLTDGAPAEDAPKLKKLSSALQLLQLVGESLKANSNGDYWIPVSTIRQCVNDQTALEIYLGLLLQVAHNKYNDIPFGDNSFYNTFNNQASVQAYAADYSQYRQYVLTVGNQIAGLENFSKLPDDAKDSVKVERYAAYVRAYADFLHTCVQASQLPFLNKIAGLKELEQNTKNYFEVVDETCDLATAINRKRYSEAVNHVVTIYRLVVHNPVLHVAILTAPPDKLSKDLKTAKEAFAKEVQMFPQKSGAEIVADLPQVRDALAATDADAMASSKALALIAKYGAFMSSMVFAKTSDDVESAIEAVALPVGSASIKKHSVFNVSLNAFVGIFGGYEQIKGVDFGQKQISFKNWNSYGITAPIGITFSTSIFRHWKNPMSLSGTTSLIDLGALVAYRFNTRNDSISTVPKVKLQNIISPGFFVSLGLPNMPISLNAGYQLGPVLRNVGASENTTSGSYSRFSVSLCVDIPILNLYTKMKGQ